MSNLWAGNIGANKGMKSHFKIPDKIPKKYE